MWVLIFVSTIALLSFIGGFIAAFWYIVPRIEQNFIFRPGREIAKTPADFGIPFDQHFIETPDGCRLSAWHMRPAQPLAHVIYFHGNGGNLGILNEIFELLYQFHLEVLAIDYRGYGWSSGTPTEDGVYLDAVAAVRYFQQNLQAGDLPLVYWGRSLGGCVAAYAASQIPPDGVVLETSFPSKASLIKHYPRYRVFYPFSRCRLETLRYLANHISPVLVLYGDQDRTVPPQESRDLFEGLSGPKQLYRVEGGEHLNLHRMDSSAYMRYIVNFIAQVKPNLKQ